MPKKKLTSAKAKKILKDGEVRGHPLTKKQKKFFGAIAGGQRPYKERKVVSVGGSSKALGRRKKK